VSLVHEKIKAIPGFPPQLAVLLEHLIVSHHGTHEFGSPALPQTREAVALHFLDDMDSKMGAMRATLDFASGASGSSVWTERNPSLRRALLRPDKFLGIDQVPGENQRPGPNGAPAATAPKPAEKESLQKDTRGLFHE
jgi:3'-5' exoribonuclease